MTADDGGRRRTTADDADDGETKEASLKERLFRY